MSLQAIMIGRPWTIHFMHFASPDFRSVFELLFTATPQFVLGHCAMYFDGQSTILNSATMSSQSEFISFMVKSRYQAVIYMG